MDDLDNILATYGSVAEYNRVNNEDDYSNYGSSSYDDLGSTAEPEFVWTVISECDDDDNRHTCYSTEYNGRTFWASHLEKGWCIEIQCSNGEYRPINSDFEGYSSFKAVAEYFEENISDYYDHIPFPSSSQNIEELVLYMFNDGSGYAEYSGIEIGRCGPTSNALEIKYIGDDCYYSYSVDPKLSVRDNFMQRCEEWVTHNKDIINSLYDKETMANPKDDKELLLLEQDNGRK